MTKLHYKFMYTVLTMETLGQVFHSKQLFVFSAGLLIQNKILPKFQEN